MSPENALRLAGPGAMLVARPTSDVRHLYVGPLTPSGRFVPRSGRTVCRARTRRLQVVAGDTPRPLCGHRGGRVCARCSTRLARRAPSTATPVTRGGQAGRGPTTRQDWRQAYAGLTMADLAEQLHRAQTPAEVDAAAHASLLLYGVAACMRPFTDDHGRDWPSLQSLTHAARGRVGGFDHTFAAQLSEKARALSLMGREQRARERAEAWREREERVTRLGINNAVPSPPPRRRTS